MPGGVPCGISTSPVVVFNLGTLEPGVIGLAGVSSVIVTLLGVGGLPLSLSFVKIFPTTRGVLFVGVFPVNESLFASNTFTTRTFTFAVFDSLLVPFSFILYTISYVPAGVLPDTFTLPVAVSIVTPALVVLTCVILTLPTDNPVVPPKISFDKISLSVLVVVSFTILSLVDTFTTPLTV